MKINSSFSNWACELFCLKLFRLCFFYRNLQFFVCFGIHTPENFSIHVGLCTKLPLVVVHCWSSMCLLEVWGCILMCGRRMHHFLKSWWKFIKIHPKSPQILYNGVNTSLLVWMIVKNYNFSFESSFTRFLRGN